MKKPGPKPAVPERFCGIDEAGRGPLAGPVVAAAVVLPATGVPDGIADSKTLPADRREALHGAICASCEFGLGIASVEEIDRLNILQATLLAMRRAVEALAEPPVRAFVDGNQSPGLAVPTECIVNGEASVPAIAAASIVAKVTRDRLMCDLAGECPGYGWERNFGYGTAQHRAALAELGVTKHHRRSFAPVRLLLESAISS